MTIIPADLTPLERDAVLAALDSPNLFLIDVADDDRERIATATIVTAASRGARVLALADTATAATALTLRLQAAEIDVVRVTDSGEIIDDLPDAVAAATPAARAASARQSLLAAVRTAEAAVLAEDRRIEDHERILARADGERAATMELTAKLHAARGGLAPLADARSRRRVFSPLFWNAVFAGDVRGRLAEVERQHAAAETKLRETDERLAELQTQLSTARQSRTRRVAERAFAVDNLSAHDDDGLRARKYLLSGRVIVAPATAAPDAGFERIVRLGATLNLHAGSPTVWLGDFAGTGTSRQLWDDRHAPTWFRDGDRLICQLVHGVVSTDEPVADRPEILASFGDTVVAAISFPATMAVAEAKAYLARELGIVRLAPLGPSRWHDEPLTVCWPALDFAAGTWIDLGSGIRERVIATEGPPRTAAVEFDPALWTSTTADEWLRQNIVPETTARLGTERPQPQVRLKPQLSHAGC